MTKTDATGRRKSETRAWIVGATDGDLLAIEAVVANGLGAVSDARYLMHYVVGKTQPPANVAHPARVRAPATRPEEPDRCS